MRISFLKFGSDLKDLEVLCVDLGVLVVKILHAVGLGLPSLVPLRSMHKHLYLS